MTFIKRGATKTVGAKERCGPIARMYYRGSGELCSDDAACKSCRKVGGADKQACGSLGIFSFFLLDLGVWLRDKTTSHCIADQQRTIIIITIMIIDDDDDDDNDQCLAAGS